MTMEKARTHLFEYFPGNFVWSQSMLSMIEMAVRGAAAMGEIDQVGRKLKDRQGDNEAWYTEWHAMAEDMERKAEAAREANHPLTAGTYYLHAGVYFLYAERFIPPSPRKFDSYRRCLRCFEEGYKRRYPSIERVEVPYEGKSLPAWFMRAPVSGKAPTVVCFDGFDSCKEMSVLSSGIELATRGMHTLAIDGPGQGEALRLRDLPSRYDYEVPGSAAYDYVAQRPETGRGHGLQPGRILRAAHRRVREALRRVCGVGCPFRLPRYLGQATGPHRGRRQEYPVRPVPTALGHGRPRHGLGPGEGQGLHPRRCRGKNILPHPHRPRRE
jgi:hypothetical protein